MRKSTALVITATLWAMVSAAAQIASGQTAAPKTAEEVYKNIVQLKGTPADQLLPAMQFIAASLNVECSFCHVQGKMEADDKPEKKTAREMIAMTMAINKDSFNGRQEISCYSCHHGAEHPAGVPPVRESDTPDVEAKAPAPNGATPAADDIIEKYVAAIGGADAMRKITSRVATGSILVAGNSSPIEVVTKAPNKRISITHSSSGGESFTAFDGTAGWLGSTGRPAREMSAAESGASGLDAEFYIGLRLKEIFPKLRRSRNDAIGGVECYTLSGSAPGKPAVRLYFGQKTGLLMRMVRYAETPVGRMPTQIDYADYRDADGVKIPFRWTLARPNGRFTIQIAEVKSNVPVADERFAKPAAEVK
jgi:photosynthetic reaction center cytochrome c subunit